MNTFNLLYEGIFQLCQSDSNIENLVNSRREEILTLLIKYVTEIETYNPTLSLVGTNDRNEMIIRHILDSLAPLTLLIKYLPQYTDKRADRQYPVAGQYSIADIGSGAGLPGIPLAIVVPDIQFTLIERMTRRANFLRNIKETLGLSNVLIEETEMEKAQHGRFNMLVFRALKPLEPKMYKKLIRLCSENGIIAAYKGRQEKIEMEMAILEKSYPGIIGRQEMIPYPVPFLNEERNLLIIRNEELGVRNEETLLVSKSIYKHT